MRTVARSALVPYTAEQMYSLVDDIPSYPRFLRWCTGATEHERNAATVEASLKMGRAGVTKSFRTRNHLQPFARIKLELVDGPFRRLDGSWLFEPLGDDGCKVSLLLEFEFENAVTDALFGRYLEDSCNSLIESFTKRAQRIYD